MAESRRVSETPRNVDSFNVLSDGKQINTLLLPTRPRSRLLFHHEPITKKLCLFVCSIFVLMHNKLHAVHIIHAAAAASLCRHHDLTLCRTESCCRSDCSTFLTLSLFLFFLRSFWVFWFRSFVCLFVYLFILFVHFWFL